MASSSTSRLRTAECEAQWKRLCKTVLAGTEQERVSAATIRVRMLKIGAAIVRNTRRVRILLASHHSLHHMYAHATRAMSP